MLDADALSPGAPVDSVRPVPRRIHSISCLAARWTAGSEGTLTIVAAVIANGSPPPASTMAGSGTSAGIAGRAGCAAGAAGGWAGAGCAAGDAAAGAPAGCGVDGGVCRAQATASRHAAI